MKKMIGLLLAALMLLCGCARREQAPQTEPVTLRVVTSFGSEDGNRRNFEAAVAAYEASTGNLVSDGSDVSSEEWKARVLTDFETGSEPDVLFFFTNADAEPFVRAGKVVPLDEIRAEYPNYAKNMDDAKLPVASDGKCYAVPVMGYWESLFVNKAVLERCGIALPGTDYTWEQFLADCQTIRSNGLTPIACSLIEMPHYWFEFAVLNRGGVDAHLQLPQLDETGTLVTDSVSEAWIAGLDDLRLLYEQGFFAENTQRRSPCSATARRRFCLMGRGKSAFSRKITRIGWTILPSAMCPRRQAACRPRRSAVFRPATLSRARRGTTPINAKRQSRSFRS